MNMPNLARDIKKSVVLKDFYDCHIDSCILMTRKTCHYLYLNFKRRNILTSLLHMSNHLLVCDNLC